MKKISRTITYTKVNTHSVDLEKMEVEAKEVMLLGEFDNEPIKLEKATAAVLKEEGFKLVRIDGYMVVSETREMSLDTFIANSTVASK